MSFEALFNYKDQFDSIYLCASASDQPKEAETLLDTMQQLSSKIQEVVRQKLDFDTTPMSKDVEAKMQEAKSRLQQLQANASRPISQPIAHASAQQLAVGFQNSSANCWINSLLSMILCVPSLRSIYETIADYHASQGNKTAGGYLKEAMRAYDMALAQQTSVPAAVSQNVRLGLHQLFNLFSTAAHAQEDPTEALGALTGEYERILKEKKLELPSLYCKMQTTRKYQLVGEPYPALRTGYSLLSNDHSSSMIFDNCAVLIDLQGGQNVEFPKLLAKSFESFSNGNDDLAELQMQSGMLSRCKLLSETHRFLRAPQEFLVTLKRFGINLQNGTRYKITSPVGIQRVLVLPPIATYENTPLTYELNAFIVHRGSMLSSGHYICYKKIEGKWIEANDSLVRFVTDQEIDRILQGSHETNFTSYLHHYSLSKNGIHLDNNSNVQPPSIMQNVPLEMLGSLEHVLWIHDGANSTDQKYGQNELNKNPHKIESITLPWLLGPKVTSLKEQAIGLHKRKSCIFAERQREIELKKLIALLGIPSTSSKELIEAIGRLPQEIQWDLHGLIYQDHRLKFGQDYVDDKKYKNTYGQVVLSQGFVREVLEQSKIAETLLETYQKRIQSLQSEFEKAQLGSFCELLQCKELSEKQLVEAFKRFEIGDRMRGKVYEEIWVQDGKPQVPSYGKIQFNTNPRCAIQVILKLLAK